MATKIQTKKAVKLTRKSEAFVSPLPRPDSAIPSMDRARDLIGAHVVADVIDAYERAKHRSRVIEDRVGGDGPDNWCVLGESMRHFAANNVARAILVWYFPAQTKAASVNALAHRWPTLGVSYRGKLYVAACGPDGGSVPIGEEEMDGDQITFLVEVDLGEGQTVRPDLGEMTDLDEFFGWNKESAK